MSETKKQNSEEKEKNTAAPNSKKSVSASKSPKTSGSQKAETKKTETKKAPAKTSSAKSTVAKATSTKSATAKSTSAKTATNKKTATEKTSVQKEDTVKEEKTVEENNKAVEEVKEAKEEMTSVEETKPTEEKETAENKPSEEAEEIKEENKPTEEKEAVEEKETAEEDASESGKGKDKKVAVSRKDMTKMQWIWKEMKRNKVGYLMIAPFLIVFILFTLFPVVLSGLLSFTSFNMLEMNSDMIVWFDNYVRLLFDDDIFLKACKNTLVFAIITGPVSYILSFLVAWFINELNPRVRAIITLIFYAPTISGTVYTVWGALFSDDAYGWVNGILIKLELIDSPILWFHDEDYAMTLCIVVALWMSLGTAFLSFIGGLQTMRKDVFEAAAVDGIKNRWQELWYITLPMMKSYLMFGAVMAITGAFGFGAVVTALCGFPSINYSCHTIMHCLEDYGNQRWEVGYASAIAFVLFLIMVGANMLVKKMLSKVGQ